MVSQQDLDSLAALDAVVRSEAFIGKCEDFLGVNCVQFDTDDHHGENKLEWTEIHNQYQALVDAELSGALPVGLAMKGGFGAHFSLAWAC